MTANQLFLCIPFQEKTLVIFVCINDYVASILLLIYLGKLFCVCKDWEHLLGTLLEENENYFASVHLKSNVILRHFTRLNTLDLSYNGIIRDETLKNLTNLTSLELGFNTKITNEGLKNLTKLTFLGLNHNKLITDDGIRHLPKLQRSILDVTP